MKKNFLKKRIKNLKSSFSQPKPVDWLRFFLIDFLFLIMFAVLLTFLLGTTLYHMKSMEGVANKALPFLTQAYSVGPSEQSVQKMAGIKQEFKELIINLVLTIALYFVLFAILISSWNFVALSKILKLKLKLKSWFKFIAVGVLWFFTSFALLILLVGFAFNKLLSVISGIILFFLIVYFSIILFYLLFFKKSIHAIKKTFAIGIKRIHTLGLAFLVCIVILLAFNLAFYFLRLPFTFLPGLIALLFFIVFLSWSRFYLCLELKEVLKHA